ncbi:MAG TPA: RibD family protein [Steroidobacteraceae bacterium]|nr:RibD family protein [Steroidobacteraceae bacterium]
MSYQAEAHKSPPSGQPPGSADASPCSEQRAWTLAYAAARAIGSFDVEQPVRFRLDEDGGLQPLAPGLSGGDLLWKPHHGWQSLGAQGSAAGLLDLYLPISSATARQPITVAHLGQSLDGFIATPSGESTFVTGPENILHLHRLRALCDAVVVGAGTVSMDNPRLTTRLVTGTNPVRIVLDPAGRLSADLTIFTDQQARTLRVCTTGNAPAACDAGKGEWLEVGADRARLNLSELMQALRARGYHRVLIEGGGVTVSSFLDAGLVDRLHIAIAPVLIGAGRPAVRLPSRGRLQDCPRMHHRVHRSGEDILFDCDLRAPADPP